MARLASALKNSQIDKNNMVVLEDSEVQLLQKALLHTLDDIIDVCDRFGIEYQMSGGNALGAIRHHGFIPWDDDLDINMTRSELRRFLPEFRRKYGYKYWIHIPGNTERYDYMMLQIMTKDIRIRKLMDPEKEECGLSTDIFIVENTFNNRMLRNIHGYGCMAFRYILSCIRFHRIKDELGVLFKNDERLNKYLKIRNRIGKISLIIPLAWWTKMADRWVSMCHDGHSKYVVITSGSKQFFEELYEREPFNKSIKVAFEGRQVNVSSDYDKYLTILYGNYMEIPPKEKREKHVMLELDKEALIRFSEE